MSNSHIDTENMDLDIATTIITSDFSITMENEEQNIQESSITPTPAGVAMAADQVAVAPAETTEDEQLSPPLTSGLEALLSRIFPPEEIVTEASAFPAQDAQPAAAIITAPNEEEQPEWEVDSSPIESSSDDSSSDDSSSDESEDGENSYKLLSPEEQARILMDEGGGSDDEGKAGKAGEGHRTKNEIPDVVIPKPDVTIPQDMPVMEVGNVETIVDNILLIKANTSGEYKVLESGSVLCLADKSVIGVVAETIGRVQQPFYSVMFTNAGELTEAGLTVGTAVFYAEKFATYIFTQALKAFKGTDASNIHDEEVGPDDLEFSDDEKEAQHKRKVKHAKGNKRGGNNGGSGRGARTSYDANQGMSYDDVGDDDGPYKPLPRPAGFAETAGRTEAPQEGQYSAMNWFSQTQGREQGRGRGRGDRGRGRGGDKRGRGGNGFSQPQQGHQNQAPGQNHQPAQFPPPAGQFSQFHQVQQTPSAILGRGNAEYSPLQPQLPNWAQFTPQQFAPPSFQQFQQFQQAFANMQNMQNMSNGWQTNPAAGPAASGAFVNPDFFQSSQNPQAGQSGHPGQNSRGRGRP